MADENEIRTNITGDASQLNAALDEAQARIDAFFAKTAKAQEQSRQYAWSRAIAEDAQRDLEKAKRYAQDWADAIVEDTRRTWQAYQTQRKAREEQARAEGTYQQAARATEQTLNSVQSRAAAMANTLRTGGVNAEDTASALRNLGFSADAISIAMKEAGFSAEEMGEEAEHGAERAQYSFFKARTAAQGLGAAMSGSPGGLMFGMARMAAASSVLGPILEAAFPVIGLLVFVDLLSQIPEMIDKITDKLAGWGKAQDALFKKNISDVTEEINRYDQLQLRHAQDQSAEVAAATGSKAAGLGAEDKALSAYQQNLAKTQDQLNALKKDIDSLEFGGSSKVSALTNPKAIAAVGSEDVPKNIDNEAFRQKFQERLGIVNHYLADIEKQSGQRQRVFDLADFSPSNTKVKENFKELSDAIDKMQKKMEDAQVDTGERRSKIGPERARAAAEESFRAFQQAEELKTITLDKASDERIASVQREVDEADRLFGQGSVQYATAQIKLATTTKAVHDAEFADVRADVTDRIDMLRSEADTVQVLNQRKLAVAIANNGAASESARIAGENMISDRRNEAQQEIGELTKVLVAAVQYHGLESVEAVKAYGEIVKARQKMAEEVRKTTQDVHEVIRKAQDDEENRNAKIAVDRVTQAHKDYDDQQKIAAARAAEQEKAGQKVGGLVGIQIERDALAAHRDAIESTRKMDVAFATEEQRLEADNLQKQLAALDQNDTQYLANKEALEKKLADVVQKGADRINEINRKANDELSKLDLKRVADREKTEETFVSFWSSEWDKMLFRARSFNQAVTYLWQDLAKKAIDSIIKIAGEYVARTIYMKAIDALMHVSFIQHLAHWLAVKLGLETAAMAKKRAQAAAETAIVVTEQAKQTAAVVAAQTKQTAAITAAKSAQAAAGAKSVADQVAANVTLAQSDVATAAAVVFLQTIEGVPWPANIAAAPAAADSTYAAGLPYVALSAAAGGWDVPGGGPFPTLLHAHEMVLPARLADSIRQMTSGYGTAQASTPGGPGAHFHYHQGDVHALDGTGVGEVMGKSPQTFVKMVSAGLRRGAFGNMKTLARRVRP